MQRYTAFFFKKSFIIREIQIKTTNVSPQASQNGHHLNNLQTINAGEGVEKRASSFIVGRNVNW